MKLPITSSQPLLPLDIAREDGRFRRCLLRAASLLLGLFTLAGLVPAAAEGQSPSIRTERYDLPNVELSGIGNELVLDFFFPPIPADVVATRFNLTFETETSAGSFDAAKIGLILQPPIDDPNDPDDRVLTLFRTGADFGWSGTGTFTFTGETEELNGTVLDAPPGAAAMLYGLTLFHADRLTNPDDLAPLGGRFVDSYIEVDYVAVPEPATACLVTIAVLVSMIRVVPRSPLLRRSATRSLPLQARGGMEADGDFRRLQELLGQ